jgi:hypothetical protein
VAERIYLVDVETKLDFGDSQKGRGRADALDAVSATFKAG